MKNIFGHPVIVSNEELEGLNFNERISKLEKNVNELEKKFVEFEKLIEKMDEIISELGKISFLLDRM